MQQGTFYPYGAKYHIHQLNGVASRCERKHSKKKNPNTVVIAIAVVEAVLLVTLTHLAW